MEKLGDVEKRQILPRNILEHYIKARTDTYASGKEPIVGLSKPGFKGYRYPEKTKEDERYLYEDNYYDSEDIPGNFFGTEENRDPKSGRIFTSYAYAGGLTKVGLKLGEKDVYPRLVKFLKEHVSDVRFGKTVTFEFEDEMGKWVYEGKGKVEDYGWADDESISLNGAELYKLRGTGVSFIPNL